MIRSIPFVLSGFAVALAFYAALRSPPNESRACDCQGWVSRADHDRLRTEVQFLAGALARRSTAAVEAKASPAQSDEADGEQARDRSAPPITRVEAPSGITVNIDATGGISVQNRDPSLVGKSLVVNAHREDGTVQPMSILVPPVTP